jgi:hypothetical protein
MDQYRSTMPRPGTGSSTVGYQASRGKGPYRDNGRVIMIIHTVTGKKDGKVHLYGQTMIGRTSPQQGISIREETTGIDANRKSATAGLPQDTRAGKGGTPV